MKQKNVWQAAALLVAAMNLAGCAVMQARAQGEQKRSNPAREIELTVYAEDFALVNERRPTTLAAGSQRIKLTAVSRSLDPRSVMLEWVGDTSNAPSLVSHSYDVGIGDGASLLDRYLGQEVEVVRYSQEGNEVAREKGRLMVSSQGERVLEADGRLIVDPAGTIMVAANEDVVTIPQLSVQVESPAAKSGELDVSYLTRGLSWSADYVASLLPTDNAISLQCWATVSNQTGATYPNAKVVLIAGEPSRAVRNARARPVFGDFEETRSLGNLMEKRKEGKPGLLAEPVGDLQSYPVEKRSDVVQGQMSRLMLMSSAVVPIKREYRAQLPWLNTYGGEATSARGSVQMSFKFANAVSHGLGVPLPAGTMRLYGEDGGGQKRYLGAAEVRNTPKDATIDVALANAFDLYTMWRVAKSDKIGKRTIRKTIEVDIHNAKKVPATVSLAQAFSGKWRVQSESHKHKKTDASTATWAVMVPAESKKTLTFVVDLG